MNKLLLAACALVAALTIAPAAGAVVYVEGTGEPAFTNSTSNTEWVRWQGSSAYDQYRLEFDYYDNSQLVKTETTPNVTANGSGTVWANWSGIVSPLLEGHTYAICGYGRYWIGGVGARDTGSCFDADQTGRRASTTIDRTKPAIAGASTMARRSRGPRSSTTRSTTETTSPSRSRRTSSAATSGHRPSRPA